MIHILCIFVVGVVSTHAQNDHQKIVDLQNEVVALKDRISNLQNKTENDISLLKGENIFFSSIQHSIESTMNKIMDDVFVMKAKLAFISMDTITENGSLDVVLELMKHVNSLNQSIGELAKRDRCQRDSQYVRECTDGNWDKSRCSEILKHVTFQKPFREIPYVMFGLSKVDAAVGHNTRFQAFITNISISGFDYHIGTWGDSILWGSTFEWLACPY